MPMMPFSGVRISWLITATKRLLLLLVSSAASSARRRCSASRACSKRSRSSSSVRASMRRDSSTVSSQNIASPPTLSQPVVPPCIASRIASGAITSDANSACPRAQWPSDTMVKATRPTSVVMMAPSISGRLGVAKSAPITPHARPSRPRPTR